MKNDLFFSNYLLTRLAASLLTREFTARGLDYKPEHFMILVLLNLNKRMTQTAIGMGSIKGKAGISRAIDHLESQGIVKRYPSPDDARENMVEMTDEGRRLLRKMRVIIKKMEHKAFQGIEDEELICFRRVLQQLIINSAKNFG